MLCKSRGGIVLNNNEESLEIVVQCLLFEVLVKYKIVSAEGFRSRNFFFYSLHDRTEATTNTWEQRKNNKSNAEKDAMC